MPGYTVLDFETTGFKKSDRVIEVACVNVSESLVIENEWTSLVNPGRSAGRTDIHGIHTDWLKEAPTFKQLAPLILKTVAGRTLVAHNAAFDSRFMFQELKRSWHNIPNKPAALCTMKWSKELLGTSKLAESCAIAGITLDNAHEAIADTRATAELLIHLGKLAGTSAKWENQTSAASKFAWPEAQEHDAITLFGRPDSKPNTVDVDAVEIVEVVEVLAAEQPIIPEKTRAYLSEIHQSYLALYQTTGQRPPELESLNMEYLTQEARDALLRGRISNPKFRDLVSIAERLGLRGEDVERALISASSQLLVAS